GPAEARDDVRHGEGLARAGDSEQRLVRQPVTDALGQPVDRLGLVARRRERLREAERAVRKREHHGESRSLPTPSIRKSISAIPMAYGGIQYTVDPSGRSSTPASTALRPKSAANPLPAPRTSKAQIIPVLRKFSIPGRERIDPARRFR